MKDHSAKAILIAGLIVAGSIYLAGAQVAKAITKPYDECVEVVERRALKGQTDDTERQRAYDGARLQCQGK